MTIIHRRIIYSIFMLAFLMLAVLMLFEATGYRYNFKKGIVQETGIIFLETRPQKVKVFLNGKLVGEKTPLQIDNLLPNKYSVRIEKEGYHNWEKEIPVYKGQTTNIQYVRLFRKVESPKLILEGEITKMIAKKNGSEALVVEKLENSYRLSILKLPEGDKKDLAILAGEIKEIDLIANETKALVKLVDDAIIIDLKNKKKPVSLKQKTGRKDLTGLKFDKYNSDDVYFLEKNLLYRLNLLSGNKEQILPFTMSQYFVSGNFIYWLSQDSLNKMWVKRVDLFAPNEVESLFSFEASLPYEIVGADRRGVLLLDKNNSNLLWWDEAQAKKELIKGAKYWVWNDKGNELLFSNNFELWIYKTDKKNEPYTLLTRLGEKIDDAKWYRPGTHIFLVTGNKIKIIENLETNRLSTDIFNLAKVNDIIIGKKGKWLYFVAKIGGQGGVYGIEIQ